MAARSVPTLLPQRAAHPAVPPPRLPRPAGKHWVVHAHVYLHREYYQPGLQSMVKPMSPQYFLKLKKGGLVALVSERPGRWGAGRHSMVGAGILAFVCKFFWLLAPP